MQTTSEWLDGLLLQYRAEQNQGLNELAGHGSADEQLKQSILDRIAAERAEAQNATAGNILGLAHKIAANDNAWKRGHPLRAYHYAEAILSFRANPPNRLQKEKK